MGERTTEFNSLRLIPYQKSLKVGAEGTEQYAWNTVS